MEDLIVVMNRIFIGEEERADRGMSSGTGSQTLASFARHSDVIR